MLSDLRRKRDENYLFSVPLHGDYGPPTKKGVCTSLLYTGRSEITLSLSRSARLVFLSQ